MRQHASRSFIPFLGPGSETQPEARWQVLPGHFVLRMHVPEPFPKEGLGWKCPHVRPRQNGCVLNPSTLVEVLDPPVRGEVSSPPISLPKGCSLTTLPNKQQNTNSVFYHPNALVGYSSKATLMNTIRGLPWGRALGHACFGRNIQAELAIQIRVGSRFRGPRKG